MSHPFRILVILAIVGWSGFGEAGEPEPADSAAGMLEQAQALVNQAAQAFASKDYRAALSALEQAEGFAVKAKDPSLPQIRFNIARCHEELGEAEAALEAYARYNELPDESHRKQRAFEAVRRLRKSVYGTLSVVCAPPGSRVEIAGVTNGAVGCPWQSDRVRPGAYAVKISHPGYERTIETVEVIAGQAVNVEAALKAIAPPERLVQVAPQRPVNVWPYMTMGTGLVVAAAGGFFTISAVDNRDDAQRLPPIPRRAELEDDFRFNRTVSYVMYGTGAALVAGGVLWWWLDRDRDEAPTALDIRPGPTGVEVRF